VARLVRAGVIVPPALPRTLEDLAVALWLVAEYWPTHSAIVTDDVDRRRRESGIRPLLAVLGPYLTEQGLRALESL
jgi:hypothetical protein